MLRAARRRGADRRGGGAILFRGDLVNATSRIENLTRELERL